MCTYTEAHGKEHSDLDINLIMEIFIWLMYMTTFYEYEHQYLEDPPLAWMQGSIWCGIEAKREER